MILLETILDEQFQKLNEAMEKVENPLDFLEEYLAARRGISLQEAKNLIILIESDLSAIYENIDKIADAANEETKGFVKKHREKLGNWVAGNEKKIEDEKIPEAKKKLSDEKIPEAKKKLSDIIGNSEKNKELLDWGKGTLKDVSKWASEKKQKYGSLAKKHQLAVVGATVGIPAVLGGLEVYAKHRRKEREKDEKDKR